MQKYFNSHRIEVFIALLFLLPSLIIFIFFSFYPIIEAFRLSFFKWDNPTAEPVFYGFKNYIELFSNDRFLNSIKVTLIYAIFVTAITIGLGLILASILNNNILVIRSFWRSLFFLPIVTPTVVAAMVWILLFNPSFGFVNTLLKQLGILGPNWFSDPNWALPLIITLGIWKRLGFTMVIYLAALQSISKEYYESAQIDGANFYQIFRKITLPLLSPTTVTLITLGLIDSFLVFDQVLVMTRGGPASSTEVLGLFLYIDAFTLFKIGKGASIAVVTFAIVAIITIVQWLFIGLGSNEDYSK